MSRMGLSLRSKSRRHTFHPSFVPEIARGYFWEVASAVGLGTAGFLVPEGNGHTSFDLLQATVASQPTVLTENGGQQFRMRRAADANPCTLQTAGSVAAGWTGATWIGMWLRLPDASGDITSFVTAFTHSGAARRIKWQGLNESPDHFLLQASTNGTTFTGVERWDNSAFLGGSAWVFAEAIFDPLLILGGSTDADRLKLRRNLVQLPVTVAGSSVGPTIADSSAVIAIANQGTGAPNSDTTDWSAAYYANGIPSMANIVKVANRMNPTGILLAA